MNHRSGRHPFIFFLRVSVPPWCKGLVFGCGFVALCFKVYGFGFQGKGARPFDEDDSTLAAFQQHSDSTSTAPSSQTLAVLSCWSCMRSAQTYLEKTLPPAPPVPAEIEEFPSVETASAAPILEPLRCFCPGSGR